MPIFRYDWVSRHVQTWEKLFEPYKNKVQRILEIGSWEGRSALFFLDYFPNSSITCVDTWLGSPEMKDWPDIEQIEVTFDRNMLEYSERVEKLKGTTLKVLPRLSSISYDFIYVDGSHKASDVFLDSLLAWPLLKNQGLMLFDDYEWDAEVSSEDDKPKRGVENFLQFIDRHYELVHKGYQVMIQKSIA